MNPRPARVVAAAGTAVAVATAAGLAGAWVRAARTLLVSPFGPGWYQIGVVAVAALCVAGVWLGLTAPGVPLGLTLVLAGWLVPLWSAWTAVPDGLRAALPGVFPLTVAGIAVCAPGRRTTLTRKITRVVAVVAVAAVATHALAYDPFEDPGCSLICTDTTPVLNGLLTTHQAIVTVGILTAVAAVTAAIGVLQASGIIRLAALLALAAALAPAGPQPTTALACLRAAGVAALAAAVVAEGARARRTRSAIDRLAATLDSSHGSPVTGDSRTEAVHFAVDERWVDAQGVEVPAAGPAPDSWLVLNDDDGPSIRLGLKRPDDRDAVLAALTPAIVLALANARLAAVVRSRVLEVQASQRRIVSASDRERRRIERDLHDGAQQSLVSIALHLSAARSRAADPADLVAAEALVHEALAGLRRLAHGIFPAALSDEGLAAALEDAAAACDSVVRLDVDLGEEPRLEVALAVYAVAALVLETATTDAEVGLRISHEATRIEVDATAAPAPEPPEEEAFDAVRDRVGALGGTLGLGPREGGGLRIRAVIPCES